jgi:hypothetical protein
MGFEDIKRLGDLNNKLIEYATELKKLYIQLENDEDYIKQKKDMVNKARKTFIDFFKNYGFEIKENENKDMIAYVNGNDINVEFLDREDIFSIDVICKRFDEYKTFQVLEVSPYEQKAKMFVEIGDFYLFDQDKKENITYLEEQCKLILDDIEEMKKKINNQDFKFIFKEYDGYEKTYNDFKDYLVELDKKIKF